VCELSWIIILSGYEYCVVLAANEVLCLPSIVSLCRFRCLLITFQLEFSISTLVIVVQADTVVDKPSVNLYGNILFIICWRGSALHCLRQALVGIGKYFLDHY
jgi:hypothetical protein